MSLFNVTNIFVGSDATYGMQSWDPTLFLGNPNFVLVKNVGNSYLFRYLFQDANVFLNDDFDYASIKDGGWLYFSPMELEGKGTGLALISSGFPQSGSQSLMIAGQRTNGSYYSNWIYRQLKIQETSDVTLSFYMNATISSNYDYMAVVVSDRSWNNKIFFATPNLQSDSQMVDLPSNVGLFKLDLSQIWSEKYNSTLPSSIYLEVQITDFDGIKDVGFIGNLTMRNNG